jgi:hypothetical protein
MEKIRERVQNILSIELHLAACVYRSPRYRSLTAITTDELVRRIVAETTTIADVVCKAPDIDFVSGIIVSAGLDPRRATPRDMDAQRKEFTCSDALCNIRGKPKAIYCWRSAVSILLFTHFCDTLIIVVRSSMVSGVPLFVISLPKRGFAL